MSDNISRQAVIDALYRCRFWSCNGSKVVIEFDDAYDAVCNVPPKDHNGEWLEAPCEDKHDKFVLCSECRTFGGSGELAEVVKNYNFCPECGADMRGSSMRMVRDLTEMNKLEDYLKANGFEYQREDEDAEPMDKHQIIVFENGVRSWDVICHYGSYGGDEGLLEGMGDLFGPDVDGYLTAEDVIKKIEEVRS